MEIEVQETVGHCFRDRMPLTSMVSGSLQLSSTFENQAIFIKFEV